MGCCFGRPTNKSSSRGDFRLTDLSKKKSRYDAHEAARRDQAIDAGLQSSHKASKVKILLLGAGESGKSTVLKQMRLIHQLGFTDPERLQYSKVLWCDAVNSMRILIRQAERLECDLNPQLQPQRELLLATDPMKVYEEDGDSRTASKWLNSFTINYESSRERTSEELRRAGIDPGVGDGLLQDYDNVDGPAVTKKAVAEAIHQLWILDDGIRQAMDQAHLFQLEVNVRYYFDHIFEFASPDYRASDNDIVQGRIKTTGISQFNFDVKGVNFNFFDVGGQRPERRKWIHCFDNVTAVLFVAAVSEYDQVLFEDERVRRLDESLQLFDYICNSRWFQNTPMILFLNKTDVLQQKLHTQATKFSHYYPQYNGDDTEYKAVLKYISNLYVGRNRNHDRPIYVHETCATDTKTMKFVMSAVTDMILQKNLYHTGVF
uniref:ARAD1D25520p n=1 Tax=Blastobotrys adeninivorans TaxID=409370 RepID=A0A060TB66_BLAAD